LKNIEAPNACAISGVRARQRLAGAREDSEQKHTAKTHGWWLGRPADHASSAAARTALAQGWGKPAMRQWFRPLCSV